MQKAKYINIHEMIDMIRYASKEMQEAVIPFKVQKANQLITDIIASLEIGLKQLIQEEAADSNDIHRISREIINEILREEGRFNFCTLGIYKSLLKVCQDSLAAQRLVWDMSGIDFILFEQEEKELKKALQIEI